MLRGTAPHINNDKLHKNGIAFANMRIRHHSSELTDNKVADILAQI